MPASVCVSLKGNPADKRAWKEQYQRCQKKRRTEKTEEGADAEIN